MYSSFEHPSLTSNSSYSSPSSSHNSFSAISSRSIRLFDDGNMSTRLSADEAQKTLTSSSQVNSFRNRKFSSGISPPKYETLHESSRDSSNRPSFSSRFIPHIPKQSSFSIGSSNTCKNKDGMQYKRRTSCVLPLTKVVHITNSNRSPSDDKNSVNTNAEKPTFMRYTQEVSSHSQNYKSTGNGQLNLQEQDFYNRLLNAHNRVDELLRSRGINAENETKNSRNWEQNYPVSFPSCRLPDRWPYVRTLSNSSDSGLSMDHELDNTMKEKVDRIDLSETLKHMNQTSMTEAVISMENVFQLSFSCQFSICNNSVNKCSEQDIAEQSFIASQTDERNEYPETEIGNMETIISCHSEFFPPDLYLMENVEYCWSRLNISLKATFSTTSTRIRPNRTHRKMLLPLGQTIEQKLIDANYQVKNRYVTRAAEISIQHCSFFHVAKSVIPEKCVRLNLRLTERTPKLYPASISLPAPPRTLLVRADILAIEKQSSSTIVHNKFKKIKRVGKLNYSFNMNDTCDQPKEIRKINRLKIPESFLNSTDAEFSNKVSNIIGGFIYENKPNNCKKNNRYSSKKTKLTSSQLCSTGKNDNISSTSIDIHKNGVHTKLKTSILSCAAQLHETTGTQLLIPSNTENYSEVKDDSPLMQKNVEQTICNKENSLLVQNCENELKRQLVQVEKESSEAQISNDITQVINYLHDENTIQSVIQPRLRRVYHDIRRFSKRIHILELPITLRKVDRSTVRPLINKTDHPKWIPSWRKTTTDCVPDNGKCEEAKDNTQLLEDES